MPDVMQKLWRICYMGGGESFSNFGELLGVFKRPGMHYAIFPLKIMEYSLPLSKTQLCDTFEGAASVGFSRSNPARRALLLPFKQLHHTP